MAIDLSLQSNETDHDESAEEAFERALLAWRVARARLETVEPRKLSAAGREAYYRTLARIGLWSDARATADVDSDGDGDALSAEDLLALTVASTSE